MVFTTVRGKIESSYLIGLRLKRQQVIPNITQDSKQPVVIGDLSSDPHWLRTADPANATTKQNLINLPVLIKGKLFGVVQIYNFLEVEMDLLLILADRLGIEIEYRYREERKTASKKRMETLVDVLGEIAGTLDRDRLLRLVTENASRLVNAERSSIFLVDPETNEMAYQVAYHSSNEEQPQNPLPLFAASPVFKRGYPTNVPAEADSQQKEISPNRDFSFFNRSAITVPLGSEPPNKHHGYDRKAVIGGLMAINKPDGFFQEDDAHLMQILANQTSTFLQVAEMYESAGELFLGVIKALVAAIDAKDPYTQGHSQRVSDYSVLIARELSLSESDIYDIQVGSLLHDIGKIGIPDQILLKVGKTTPEEFRQIKRHPLTGMNILKQVKLLEPMIPGIAEHHERLDGSGYPRQLAGDQISIMGRIVAVADVYDAMTSDRPYRPAVPVAETLDYLCKNSGNLFDPNCVRALKAVLAKQP
jgi:GAF domain-containing protein